MAFPAISGVSRLPQLICGVLCVLQVQTVPTQLQVLVCALAICGVAALNNITVRTERRIGVPPLKGRLHQYRQTKRPAKRFVGRWRAMVALMRGLVAVDARDLLKINRGIIAGKVRVADRAAGAVQVDWQGMEAVVVL